MGHRNDSIKVLQALSSPPGTELTTEGRYRDTSQQCKEDHADSMWRRIYPEADPSFLPAFPS